VTVLGGRPGTDRTQEIEARVNAATEGPWATDGESDLDEWYAEFFQVRWPNPDGLNGSEAAVLTFTKQDAEFIAHAREDVPWLLAERAGLLERVRSLEAANERLERILYPPDSPPREDASGEASQSEVVVTAAASATDLPQCTCKWGASGAHNDGCPCAVLDVASPANEKTVSGTAQAPQVPSPESTEPPSEGGEQ
jgi:hypothetical protein